MAVTTGVLRGGCRPAQETETDRPSRPWHTRIEISPKFERRVAKFCVS